MPHWSRTKSLMGSKVFYLSRKISSLKGIPAELNLGNFTGRESRFCRPFWTAAHSSVAFDTLAWIITILCSVLLSDCKLCFLSQNECAQTKNIYFSETTETFLSTTRCPQNQAPGIGQNEEQTQRRWSLPGPRQINSSEQSLSFCLHLARKTLHEAATKTTWQCLCRVATLRRQRACAKLFFKQMLRQTQDHVFCVLPCVWS